MVQDRHGRQERWQAPSRVVEQEDEGLLAGARRITTCAFDCRRIDERPAMEMSEYDEIRATVRLPNLDIGILHRRPWEGNEEQIVVMLRAVPSFEAVGRWLEASNPLLVWSRMMQAAWSPWCTGSAQPSPQASDHHPCLVTIRPITTEQSPESPSGIICWFDIA